MMSFAQTRKGRGSAAAFIAIASIVGTRALMGQQAPQEIAMPHPDAVRPAFLACAGLSAEEVRSALVTDAINEAIATHHQARTAMDAANAALRLERARVWREGGDFSEQIVSTQSAARERLMSAEATLEQALDDALAPLADEAGLMLARRAAANFSPSLPIEYSVMDLSEEGFTVLAQARRLHDLGKELSGAHAEAFALAERSPNVLLVRQRLAALLPALEDFRGEACVDHGLAPERAEPQANSGEPEGNTPAAV